MAALKDRNPGVRARAATAIEAIGPSAAPATDALVAVLEDDFEAVRISALLALARIEAEAGKLGAIVPRLLADDESDEVRAHAALLLGELGRKDATVVAALLGALGDANAEVRASAAW